MGLHSLLLKGWIAATSRAESGQPVGGDVGALFVLGMVENFGIWDLDRLRLEGRGRIAVLLLITVLVCSDRGGIDG